MKSKSVFITALFLVGMMLALHAATAAVGVGLSPAKVIIQIPGGTEQDFEFLVFNSGDGLLNIALNVDGDIARFTKLNTMSMLVEPEPQPHALPIKNGQTFSVKFAPPASGEQKVYSGTITASGTPGGGSQLGGTVGVAVPVEIIVTPPASILAFITPTYAALIIAILLIIALVIVFSKSGFKISIQRSK